MNYLDQLDQMLDANHPIVSMETYDPDRVEDLITQLSRFSNKAYYVARPNQGMYRVGASHISIPRTEIAKELLEHILNARHFGVYILRDYHEVLEDESLVEKLLEISKSEKPKVVVLLGEFIDLPRALKPYTLRSKHQMRKAV